MKPRELEATHRAVVDELLPAVCNLPREAVERVPRAREAEEWLQQVPQWREWLAEQSVTIERGISQAESLLRETTLPGTQARLEHWERPRVRSIGGGTGYFSRKRLGLSPGSATPRQSVVVPPSAPTDVVEAGSWHRVLLKLARRRLGWIHEQQQQPDERCCPQCLGDFGTRVPTVELRLRTELTEEWNAITPPKPDVPDDSENSSSGQWRRVPENIKVAQLVNLLYENSRKPESEQRTENTVAEDFVRKKKLAGTDPKAVKGAAQSFLRRARRFKTR